jgi:signal transduction histidine kinase
LTNARKHGGDQVEVLVDRRPDGVDLQVINDLPTDAKRLQTGDVPGHGLNGMGERVAAVGGRLVTEHTKDGFIVHAWLPDTPDTVSGD